MSLLPPLIRLNKRMFTRNSVAVRIGLARIVDVDSIEWSDEVPHELVPGMNDGGPALGKARGLYTCEAMLSVYADAASSVETLMLLENPLAGVDLSQVNFQLLVNMTEDVRTRGILIANCNVVGRPSRTVGNDGSAIVMQYKLQPTYIIEDGKGLLNPLPSF